MKVIFSIFCVKMETLHKLVLSMLFIRRQITRLEKERRKKEQKKKRREKRREKKKKRNGGDCTEERKGERESRGDEVEEG